MTSCWTKQLPVNQLTEGEHEFAEQCVILHHSYLIDNLYIKYTFVRLSVLLSVRILFKTEKCPQY